LRQIAGHIFRQAIWRQVKRWLSGFQYEIIFKLNYLITVIVIGLMPIILNFLLCLTIGHGYKSVNIKEWVEVFKIKPLY